MRAPLLTCSLLLLAAASASAHGTHVRWNACYGDGGTTSRSFACDTNSGSEQLACTFILSSPVAGVYQMDAFVRFSFAGTTLPAWWQFRTPGSCRTASLTASTLPPVGASSCIDWADGARDGLLTYATTALGPNTTQLELLSPVAPVTAYDLVAGQEYLALTAVINHQKTVGTGACGGCTLGGCMGFVAVKLIRTPPPAPNVAPPPDDVLIAPDVLLDQVVTWQGGEGIAIPNYLGMSWTYCPGATPARNRTWGGVKAMYR